MKFKVGDYVEPTIENESFYLSNGPLGIGYSDLTGVVVQINNNSLDGQDSYSNCSIDILNLSTGKLSKEWNDAYFRKTELPEGLIDRYNLLIINGLYCTIFNYMEYKVEQRNFWGKRVWINLFMDELRKTQCLCLNCEKMTGIKETNCKKAQRLYEMCVEEDMSLAITKCGTYVYKREKLK